MTSIGSTLRPYIRSRFKWVYDLNQTGDCDDPVIYTIKMNNISFGLWFCNISSFKSIRSAWKSLLERYLYIYIYVDMMMTLHDCTARLMICVCDRRSVEREMSFDRMMSERRFCTESTKFCFTQKSIFIWRVWRV